MFPTQNYAGATTQVRCLVKHCIHGQRIEPGQTYELAAHEAALLAADGRVELVDPDTAAVCALAVRQQSGRLARLQGGHVIPAAFA
ncbi:MAG: hypothetical protein LC125_06780 [Burkholderiales bacterium]|nr:hypothetical protein [Burkholderiales bacterium]